MTPRNSFDWYVLLIGVIIIGVIGIYLSRGNLAHVSHVSYVR